MLLQLSKSSRVWGDISFLKWSAVLQIQLIGNKRQDYLLRAVHVESVLLWWQASIMHHSLWDTLQFMYQIVGR